MVNFSRWLVGLLFIFSGIVKANDPHGLSYKMQEFFERWAADGYLPSLMNWLHQFSLEFSIVMIALEIVAGVAILLGLWKNFFTWLLFILIIFFTFLTGYAALSGKIAECGCFGNCIPLTSMQSFIKDLILFVLIIILLLGRRYITPAFSQRTGILLLALSLVVSVGFQWYVMRNLPVVDCLPFKPGNNILELRKMPADAIPDKVDYIFIYEKDGKQKEFTVKDLPDSTWGFVSRKDVIVEKGSNNEPPIKDFTLVSQDGTDSTESILTLDKNYFLFFVNNIGKSVNSWQNAFREVYSYAKDAGMPLTIVTSDPQGARRYFNEENHFDLPVMALDAVAFKTAARTNPELYLMHGPVIQNKWGRVNLKKAIKP